MVMVGRTFSDRPTTRSPTWLKVWGALADGLNEGVFGVAGAGLGTDAEQGREDRRLEQHAPIVIDLVRQAGIPCRIGARLALQNDRAAVRHDEAVPHQQRPGLAERHLGAVFANKAGIDNPGQILIRNHLLASGSLDRVTYGFPTAPESDLITGTIRH